MYKNRIKKIFTWVLVVALMIAICTPVGMPVYAAENVLEISSVRELKEFATKVNNGNTYENWTVKLTKNIAFDNSVDNFETIGSLSHPFKGTFDGNYHTVSGIDCTGNGFFGWIWSGAVVKNLALKNCDFYGGFCDTGAIVGEAGINGDVATISNCHVMKGSVTATGGGMNSSNGDAGGIVGSGSAIITNCSNTATVIGCSAGGIIGDLSSGNISNCYNAGEISSYWSTMYSDGYRGAGGIVGKSVGAYGPTIQNCYNIGKADAGIAYDGGGTYGNCYCSEESADVNFNYVGREKNNKAYPLSYIQSDSFLKILNKNAKEQDEWATWKITKSAKYPVLVTKPAKQSVSVKKASAKFKVAALKKVKQSFKIGAKAKTEIGYKVKTGKKYISVSSDGVVTIKKGTPAGSYSISVTAEGNAKYKSVTKTVKITVSK